MEKERKWRDKYSIKGSEGDKIFQNNEETDKDGKTAERKQNTNNVQRGSDG